MFIYKNWLIAAIIYHSSQVGNRREVLKSGEKGEEIWYRKTTKS